MLTVKDKNVLHSAELEFYFESLKIKLSPDRNGYKNLEEKSNGETVDVLLSVMPGLITEIEMIVNRMKFF
jgi:hypothetical protein